MKFAKAKPEQGFVKISLYGPPGSGKTFTTLLVAEGLAAASGKRIAYIDTERGTDFYAKNIAERKTHPEAFDFDAVYTRSLAACLEAVKSLKAEEHGVIVIDSISHLWDAAMAAYEGRMTKVDTIPMQAWGKIKKPYKEFIKFLMDAPFHIFILGRQKNIFEDDIATDKMIKVGVGMRAEGETAYEPHICARMEARKSEKDSARSTVYIIFEKDRTGILDGRTIANPSFKTFEPLLPILGDTQARSEDPDEVAARDGELLDMADANSKEKEEKSKVLLSEFNAKLSSAIRLEDVAVIASEIKKQSRYMKAEHKDVLRIFYTKKHEELANQIAKAEI